MKPWIELKLDHCFLVLTSANLHCHILIHQLNSGLCSEPDDNMSISSICHFFLFSNTLGEKMNVKISFSNQLLRFDFSINSICRNLTYSTLQSQETRVSNSTTSADETSLRTLQNRILLFFGTVDANVMLKVVHKNALNTNATWNHKQSLPYELPYPEKRLPICFDRLLPRIIQVATCSGDRRTRVAACEFLHSLITIILGSRLIEESLDQRLQLALIRLGCDLDEVIKNVYYPFVLQLIHFLSSRQMAHQQVSKRFVEILFERLIEETDTAMVDFCGVCLREFIHWLDKQGSSRELIDWVIERLTKMAMHPAYRSKLGAAIVFNHTYTILREDPRIVDEHWLEFFYVFVKTLEDCTDVQVTILYSWKFDFFFYYLSIGSKFV